MYSAKKYEKRKGKGKEKPYICKEKSTKELVNLFILMKIIKNMYSAKRIV